MSQGTRDAKAATCFKLEGRVQRLKMLLRNLVNRAQAEIHPPSQSWQYRSLCGLDKSSSAERALQGLRPDGRWLTSEGTADLCMGGSFEKLGFQEWRTMG